MSSEMRSYPIPVNDTSRGLVIEAMDLTRRQGDPFFGYVTEAAKRIFGAPVAFLSLIKGDTQCLLHCDGVDVPETPRQMSLCAFTVAAKKTIVLHDTLLDPRSAGHPIVTGGFRLRFSASAPVILSSGYCVGTLCAVDFVPHDAPEPHQVEMLESLAAMTARFYEVPAEPDPVRAAELRRIVDDAQDEFLSLVSHELRTPLNGIYGMAQLLDLPDGENAALVRAITDSAELLNGIVESILSFTQMKSGDIVLDEETFDVGALIGAVAQTQAGLMRADGKTCDASGLPVGLSITADRAKIELALSCLMMNFVAHGGQMARVGAHRGADGTLVVTLSDDGEGISPDRESRIWEAFGTGKSVRRRDADGIGLGLPLTRRIVELHGGEFDLIQSHPGMSAVIRLPAWRVCAPD